MEKVVRHFALMLFLMILGGMLSGCGNKAAQNEVLHYVNVEMKELDKLEEVAVFSFNSVFGDNFKDGESAVAVITNTTIPAAKRLLEKAESIKITNEDLKAVHNIFKQRAKTLYDGLCLMVEAADAGDGSKMVEANKHIEKSNDYGNEYHEKLKEVCKKYDVILKLDK